MFGADAAAVLRIASTSGQHKDRGPEDGFEYLLPPLSCETPLTLMMGHHAKSHMEDFIMISEFSEQEGPRPVIVIPKDGGAGFDKNEFSVRILSVDHQSSITDGCHITEDAQVVMSDQDTNANAFIHHIVLNDIQARGYVRPFCIAYVTTDPMKVMKAYKELSEQLNVVSRLMKYGNRLVFIRDLEKHLEDLSYTKAHLLISQRSAGQSQNEGELFHLLNTIRQSMEEIKDIISNLQPLMNDPELEKRFRKYELKLKGGKQEVQSDSSSLKDFDMLDSPTNEKEMSGSYTEQQCPEFSLFMKSKDQKPKVLDVSAIKGKRRFDRSLRGLHSLCSWGAKEGLQRLRAIRESLKRDMSSITLDEVDACVIDPECGMLTFGHGCIGANFLSSHHSMKDVCCLKRKGSFSTSSMYQFPQMPSFGSLDSFKSLPSSLDEEVMYSAHSSMTEGTPYFYDRKNSSGTLGSVDNAKGSDEEEHYEIASDLEVTMKESSDSLTIVNKSDMGEYGEEILTDTKFRSQSLNSEYVHIDKEKDLVCEVKGCSCKQKELVEPSQCDKPNIHVDCDSNNSVLNGKISSKAFVARCKDVETCDKDYADDTNVSVDNIIETITSVKDDNKDKIERVATYMTGKTDIKDEKDEIRNEKLDRDDAILDVRKTVQHGDQHAVYASDDTKGIEATSVIPNNDNSSMNTACTDVNIVTKAKEPVIPDNSSSTTPTSSEIFDSLESETVGGNQEENMDESMEQERILMKDNRNEEFDTNAEALISDKQDTEFSRYFSHCRKTPLYSPMLDQEIDGATLLRVFTTYNNLQHIVYSLLSGRPVVVIATNKHEVTVREFLHALSIFTPVIPGCVSLVCQMKQLHVSDIHKFLLRGLIRPEKRSVDYLVPASMRKFITLVDFEKMLLTCQPYQGTLLSFVSSVFGKKKTFKSAEALLAYLQTCILEISTKAFNFYHCFTEGDTSLDFSGTFVPRKSTMLEMSGDKYLNKAGLSSADCRIVKHLAEIVKLQQIEQEYRSKYLTDSPAFPFSMAYQTTQTLKL